MNIEEAIDILKNSIADYVIGDYCEKCADNKICEDRNEDCYYIQAIDIVLNLIQKQDTEINKLKNVIDKMVTWINDHEDPFKDCHETNISCADKECEDCIKEYFMKEDKYYG